QLTIGRPELVAFGVQPCERDDVGAHILEAALQPHHEVRARMYRGEATDLDGVENAEHVQLPLLREVGRIGEEREGDVHRRTLSAGLGERLVRSDTDGYVEAAVAVAGARGGGLALEGSCENLRTHRH